MKPFKRKVDLVQKKKKLMPWTFWLLLVFILILSTYLITIYSELTVYIIVVILYIINWQLHQKLPLFFWLNCIFIIILSRLLLFLTDNFIINVVIFMLAITLYIIN